MASSTDIINNKDKDIEIEFINILYDKMNELYNDNTDLYNRINYIERTGDEIEFNNYLQMLDKFINDQYDNIDKINNWIKDNINNKK